MTLLNLELVTTFVEKGGQVFRHRLFAARHLAGLFLELCPFSWRRRLAVQSHLTQEERA